MGSTNSLTSVASLNSSGRMLLGMLFWHTLVPLLPTVIVWVPQFFEYYCWLCVSGQSLPSSSRIMYWVTKQKSNWFHEHASPVTRSKVSRTSWGNGWRGESQHECAADKSAEIIWCNHVSMESRVWSLTQNWEPCSRRWKDKIQR